MQEMDNFAAELLKVNQNRIEVLSSLFLFLYPCCLIIIPLLLSVTDSLSPIVFYLFIFFKGPHLRKSGYEGRKRTIGYSSHFTGWPRLIQCIAAATSAAKYIKKQHGSAPTKHMKYVLYLYFLLTQSIHTATKR